MTIDEFRHSGRTPPTTYEYTLMRPNGTTRLDEQEELLHELRNGSKTTLADSPAFSTSTPAPSRCNRCFCYVLLLLALLLFTSTNVILYYTNGTPGEQSILSVIATQYADRKEGVGKQLQLQKLIVDAPFRAEVESTVTDKPESTTTAAATTTTTTSQRTDHARSTPFTTTAHPTAAADAIACKFPHLAVDDPLIKPYLQEYGTLKCGDTPNWVYTANSRFFISREAVSLSTSNDLAAVDNVDCTYIHLERTPNDASYTETEHKHFANGSLLLGEAFVADCTAKGAHSFHYRNLHAGVPFVAALHRNRTDETPDVAKLDLNVYIYLMDSLSRVNFVRKLPRFYKFLTEEMGAFVMSGFNTVGDGTPWTMIPVTTGHFQTELYEARKRFSNASYVDGWPLVFKDYKRAGYVTSYGEEQPQFSFFSYKLKGFNAPPVDHYLRTFLLAVNWEYKHHKSYCLGDRPRSLTLCDWWAEQQDIYPDKRTFSIMFSSETSHDSYNLVQVLDEHWEKKFREQHRAGYFNNTLVVVMGDHGRRFGEVRQTQSGKTEEKLPFLAVAVPKSFRERYPNAYRNLQTNTKRLVTPFDLHATLMHTINFTSSDGIRGDLKRRGISLFDEIPAERTCAHAWIKPHFCSCLDWTDLGANSTDVQTAVAYAIDRINKQNTDAANKMCAPLRLDRILSARMLKPSAKMLAFKESADYDNIHPDLTADVTTTNVLYQLRFTTLPNGGDYEASLNYFATTKSFTLSFDDVSRLNMYGDQPHCVLNTQHHLRAYCYCADLLTRGGDAAKVGLFTLAVPEQYTNSTQSA